MQVTVETTSGLERKMRVVVPSEKVESQVQEKIKQTAKQVRLKGFRPGKVPVKEVKRRFGDGIRQEVSSEVIQSSYGEALQQEDINPAGLPTIEEIKMAEGEDLEYTAIFEVFPDIEVAGFDVIEVERLTSQVEESDIDAMIETLREQRLEYKEVDRKAKDEDQVTLDFEGFIDDEAFDGGKGEGANIILGSGTMIPGFEDGLKGLKAGDEKDLEVTFPEAYQAESLAGKEAVFKIKVSAVGEPHKPELNDDFFEIFDVTEGGLEAFRTEVKENMQRELDAAIKARVKDQVMDGLFASNELELPRALIDQEVNRMRQEAVQRFGGPEAKVNPNVLPAEMFADQAERRVKLGLIVNKIVEQHEIKPDDGKVKETIETMASSYEDPEQVISFYYSNEQQLNQIQSMVLEEQIVDLVLESAKVEDKAVSYDEAVKKDPPAALAEETEEKETEAVAEDEAPAAKDVKAAAKEEKAATEGEEAAAKDEKEQDN